ncbi:sulfur carrier protein ThiS [Corynebacterium pseudopelargi]|uniref:Sulfur carrier protein ThiS n=1 Tax=Corynebacterium pseudopelargi TaxID=2080757 RepID=A0A3G6IRK9_9CORY|nr:sulfur carrier protein ThiS [Corynebacterium pseudopelargi]AZA08215.1 Sulfur carrier protein ThiS [Corynebacterium pseudopelargi]
MKIQLNGNSHDVDANATLEQVVALITADTAGTAAAVNEEVVPKANWAQYSLHEGDAVEILTAVQGG